jgi:hypothetical protein
VEDRIRVGRYDRRRGERITVGKPGQETPATMRVDLRLKDELSDAIPAHLRSYARPGELISR